MRIGTRRMMAPLLVATIAAGTSAALSHLTVSAQSAATVSAWIEPGKAGTLPAGTDARASPLAKGTNDRTMTR